MQPGCSLSDLCSQALQRAKRTDAGTELVHHLQSELLAAIDPADGLDVAVGYRPAVGALGFGGDWYDVVAARPDATAIIVGDVVGHGVGAAAEGGAGDVPAGQCGSPEGDAFDVKSRGAGRAHAAAPLPKISAQLLPPKPKELERA